MMKILFKLFAWWAHERKRTAQEGKGKQKKARENA